MESDSLPFLYDYRHTAPSLQQSSLGVKTVDANSVYRIGDLTKLFTVWTFPPEVGDKYWNDLVTKYVPELAMLEKNPNNLVEHVD